MPTDRSLAQLDEGAGVTNVPYTPVYFPEIRPPRRGNLKPWYS